MSSKAEVVRNYAVSIVTWPASQLCMGCDSSTFIDCEKFGNGAYVCSIGVKRMYNYGTRCPHRTVDNEVEKEFILS